MNYYFFYLLIFSLILNYSMNLMIYYMSLVLEVLYHHLYLISKFKDFFESELIKFSLIFYIWSFLFVFRIKKINNISLKKITKINK